MDQRTAGRIFARGASYEIEKVAKVGLTDVEKSLGMYLPDRFEAPVRDLIKSETAARPILARPGEEIGKRTLMGGGIGAAIGAGLATLARKPRLLSALGGGVAGGVIGLGSGLTSKEMEEKSVAEDIVGKLHRHPEIAPLAKAKEQLDHERQIEMMPVLEQKEKTKRQMALMNTYMAGAQKMLEMINENQLAQDDAKKD